MTYETEKDRVGRLPFQVVKLSLDHCTKRYGVNDPSTGGFGVCLAGTRTTGTAQGGSTTSVTLAASASSTDGFYEGYAIFITSGSADGELKRITAYDGTTKEATLDTAMAAPVANLDTYELIERVGACYNTRETCQDLTNYDPDPTSNEIYLTEANSNFPVDLLDTSGLAVAIPCLKSVKITPPRLNIGRGLGMRSNVDITCYDFPHGDNGIDPYYLSRNYDPATQGTFWGKLLARNPYYTGRLLTVYRGYLEQDGTFDLTNYNTWVYAIDRIDGIQRNDTVKLTAKDILKKADDKKAQVPKPSTGLVLTSFLAADASFTVTPTGVGDAEYPASGTARISDEIFDFTRVGDVFTFDGTRGQYGTTASDHDAGDSVQLCLVYTNENVVDIVQDLLDVSLRSDTNGLGTNAGIPTAQLDIAGWTSERNLWLSSNLLTRVISKPFGVNQLLTELTEQNLFYMWWDAKTSLVKLRAIAPVREGSALTDDDNFIADSIKVWEDQKLRTSQTWIFYGVRNWAEDTDKLENYKSLYVGVDTEQEDPDTYNESQIDKIISQWITTEALAVQLSGRLLNIYGRNVKFINFDLDNKDDVSLGDNITVSTRYIQDVDGSNKTFNMIVIEENEKESGSINSFRAQQFELLGSYGYIGYSHTGRMASNPASNQVVLDTRTSRWEDPGLEIDEDNSICEGPDVALNGIALADDFLDVPAWPDDCFVDHVFHIHAPGETYDGFTSIVTAYDASTSTLTLEDDLPVGATYGASTGDIYHIHLAEYTGSYLLLEGSLTDALLLEDEGFTILEESSIQGATLAQKSAYCWIGPDDPATSFEDGTDRYKIL